MIPPCFEHSAGESSSLSAITGAPLPPTLEKFRDKAPRCIRVLFFAPLTERQLSEKKENVTISLHSIYLLQDILTQFLCIVNDFGKKSFAVVTEQFHVEHLGVKLFGTAHTNFKEIGCMTVCFSVFKALKKHSVSAARG